MSEDIQDDSSFPVLAEFLYAKYQSDIIPFMADALETMMKKIESMYPQAHDAERVKMTQSLKLEIVMKFCHYAENLAAISISFTENYVSPKDEALGLFDTVNDYKVRQAVDFFRKIPERNLEYVAKFLGYPPFSVQNPQALETIKRWSNNAKEEYVKIGEDYLAFQELYNAYKHGFRIFLGTTQNHDDGYVFLYKGKQQLIIITNDKFEKIKRNIRFVEKLMKIIFANHLERGKYEERNELNAQIIWHYLRKKDDPPHDPTIRTQLTKRGERRQKEVEEANEIYKKFQSELESNHLNKVVVLDLDSKNIVGIADTNEEAVKIMHESTLSSRKYIRKIGIDDKTGLEYY